MPDRYAVIGNPVAHSKSPLIHAEFARQTAQDIVYVRLPVPKRSFRIELDRFMAHGGRGLNITVPFKEEAAGACTQLSERAKFAQAANTLTLADGKVIGDNTDGAGMLRDLENNLRIAVHGRRVLLMGAGGAARGVLMPLIAMSKADIIRRGQALGVDYSLTVSCYQADGEGRACGRCDSCRLRRAGFAAADVPDPTRYY